MRVFHDVMAVGLVGAVLMAGPARASSSRATDHSGDHEG